MDHCKDSVFSRHHRGAAHRNSQCLCRHVQGLRKFKPEENLSAERGKAGGQHEVPLLAEDPWSQEEGEIVFLKSTAPGRANTLQ